MSVYKPTSPVKASTQEFVEIEEVKDDILLLKDHSCVTIIECGAVNFDLLDPEEQQSIVYSYSSLLNSLSFAIQIVILSRRKDISSYLTYLDGKIQTQQNQVLQARLLKYQEFIKSLVKRSTILEKKFYFVISFSPLELGTNMKQISSASSEYIITRAKTSLYPKRDHLVRLLQKLGLRGHTLQDKELTDLFYNIYNVSDSNKKLDPIESYTNIVVTQK